VTGLAGAALLAALGPLPAAAGELVDSLTLSSAAELVDIDKGGLLYDNWFKQLGMKAPNKTHPAYPSAGKKKGATTWRCKECHGWDYKGRDGLYAKGSHYTGIIGLRNLAHAAPERIVAALKSKTHHLKGTMPVSAMRELAEFVSKGQIETALYIDPETKTARGDPKRGERIFLLTCARCHGTDGKLMNFKTPSNPEYVGTVARENPWEVLHKIRFGQPGMPMISLLAFDPQAHADVLAFAQTLPEK